MRPTAKMFMSKRMFSPTAKFNGKGTPRQRKKDNDASVEAIEDARSGARGVQEPVDTGTRAIEEDIEMTRVEAETRSTDDLLNTVVIGAVPIVAVIVIDTLGDRAEKLDTNKNGNWRERYFRNKQTALERKKANIERERQNNTDNIIAADKSTVVLSGKGASSGDITIVHRDPLDGRHALGDFSGWSRLSALKMCSTAKMSTSERILSPMARSNGKYARYNVPRGACHGRPFMTYK
jgi:hypothetical protein